MRITRTFLMAWALVSLCSSPAMAQGDDGFFEGDAYPEADGPEADGFEVEEGGAGPDAAATGSEEVDVSYFFDKLAPHGEWIWTPEYGWVWHPSEIWEDWRPFTYGRWVHTEYGWTWSSYFPWGWATFHYGSWAFLDYIGWVWVPGTTWAPARVMWRTSDVYIGWAPILAGYDYWYGWAYYPVYYHHWTFINWHHFCDSHPHHHYVPREAVTKIFRHTYFPRRCRNRSGDTCQRGPNSRMVGDRSNNPVRTLKVDRVKLNPGATLRSKQSMGVVGDVVKIHRPEFKKGPQRLDLGGGSATGTRRVKDLGIVSTPRRTRSPAVRTYGDSLHTLGNDRPRGVVPGASDPTSSPDRRSPSPGRSIHPRQPAVHHPGVRMPHVDQPNGSRRTPGGAVPAPSTNRSTTLPRVRSNPHSPSSMPRIHRTAPAKSAPVHSAPKVRSPSVRSAPSVRSNPSPSRSSSSSSGSRSSSRSRKR